MKKKLTPFTLLFCLLIMYASCESEAKKEQRLEQARIELEEEKQKEAVFQKEVAEYREQKRIAEEKASKEKLIREEQELEELRIVRQKELEAHRIQEEKERKAKALREKYIGNSLNTGATPYAYCYGGNKSCSDYGCSQIKVKTPYNSDVMVTIKRSGVVYSHAYIKAGSQFTFDLPDGTYQPFFYYGKGWNPNKVMVKTDCGTLKGGFIEEEVFGKDSPQRLSNSILSYELILQKNGNFSTQPSNPEEAF